MEAMNNYFEMSLKVRKELKGLEKKIKKDKDYLSSKLKVASEDQLIFYDYSLSSERYEDLVNRYNALFSPGTPEEEDYVNMVYYVNNLRYFFPFDTSKGFSC